LVAAAEAEAIFSNVGLAADRRFHALALRDEVRIVVVVGLVDQSVLFLVSASPRRRQ